MFRGEVAVIPSPVVASLDAPDDARHAARAFGGAVAVLLWARWRHFLTLQMFDVASIPLSAGYAIGLWLSVPFDLPAGPFIVCVLAVLTIASIALRAEKRA